MSLSNLFRDNQFSILLSLVVDLYIVHPIFRVLDKLLVCLELFEQFAILFQCPLERALADDATIVSKGNDEVSDRLDKRNIMALQHHTIFSGERNRYHSDLRRG